MKDGRYSISTVQNSYWPVFALAQEETGNAAKTRKERDASQRSKLPGIDGFISLTHEMIQLSCGGIALNLAIPFIGHEFFKPLGKPGQILGGQLCDSLF